MPQTTTRKNRTTIRESKLYPQSTGMNQAILASKSLSRLYHLFPSWAYSSTIHRSLIMHEWSLYSNHFSMILEFLSILEFYLCILDIHFHTGKDKNALQLAKER